MWKQRGGSLSTSDKIQRLTNHVHLLFDELKQLSSEEQESAQRLITSAIEKVEDAEEMYMMTEEIIDSDQIFREEAETGMMFNDELYNEMYRLDASVAEQVVGDSSDQAVNDQLSLSVDVVQNDEVQQQQDIEQEQQQQELHQQQDIEQEQPTGNGQFWIIAKLKELFNTIVSALNYTRDRLNNLKNWFLEIIRKLFILNHKPQPQQTTIEPFTTVQ